MADQSDVRRIASRLPDVVEGSEFCFAVRRGAKTKGFAWVWLERTDQKGPRLPNPEVLAVRVVDEDDKRALIESDPKAFFTERHYNGFPAVLIRLPVIDISTLEEVLVDAWKCQATKAQVRQFESGRESG